MKFYRYTEPYLALIVAKDEESANKAYEEVISPLDKDDPRPAEITEEEARKLWDDRAQADEKDTIFDDALLDEETSILLIDACLE